MNLLVCSTFQVKAWALQLQASRERDINDSRADGAVGPAAHLKWTVSGSILPPALRCRCTVKSCP